MEGFKTLSVHFVDLLCRWALRIILNSRFSLKIKKI